MAQIRLITFDVTGTLLNFKTPVMAQYSQVAKRYGINVEPETLSQNFKKAWKIISADHPNFGQRTGIGWRQWWKNVVIETFRGYDQQTTRPLADELIEHFKTKNAWKVVNGAENLLKRLRNDNYNLGVISNFDPRLHDILENLNLSDNFSFVLTSYEAGWEKPDSRIFREALRKGKVDNGSQALHIGNDLKLDVEAAKKAGLNSLFVGNDTSLSFPFAVQELNNVYNVIEYLKNT